MKMLSLLKLGTKLSAFVTILFHRKLKELLKGSDQWDEFESTVEDRQPGGDDLRT